MLSEYILHSLLVTDQIDEAMQELHLFVNYLCHRSKQEYFQPNLLKVIKPSTRETWKSVHFKIEGIKRTMTAPKVFSKIDMPAL